MIDVILINPICFNQPPLYKNIEDVTGARTPLSVLSLGSYLSKKGYNIKLIDVNIYSMAGSNSYLQDLKRLVDNNNILCVGLSVMTSQIPNAYLITKLIKKLDSNIHVTWGGIHPTLYPKQTSKDKLIDTVIFGPGEKPLEDLINFIGKGKNDFRDIKNVAFSGKINESRAPMDVNKIPFLDYDLLNAKFYIWHSNHFLFQKDIRMLPILSSRGCPYRCTFCINKVCRTNWRPLTPDRFLDELEFLIYKYKLEGVRILDENFFISKKRTEEIIKKLKKRNIEIIWGTNVRADCFKESYFNVNFTKKLKNSGFTFASIGAESGSDRILKFIKKDITTQDIINSAKTCHESDITPVYSWMTGLPTELKEEMISTIKLITKIKKICPSSIHYSLNIYRPFPGGELYDICVKQGLKEPKSLKEWVDPTNLDIVSGSIPIEKCVWIKDKDFVQFISNYTEEIVDDIYNNGNKLHYLYQIFIKLRWNLQFFKFPNTERNLVDYIGYQLQKLKGIN